MKEAAKIDIGKVYDDYGAALYGVIHRIIKDDNIATEVLQDTFVKVWKYQDRYDPSKSSLFTWMMHIARNTAINATQTKYARNKSKTDQVGEISKISTFKTTQINVDALDVNAKVNNLEDKYREIIELVYFQGYSQSEISKNLEIPLGTVKSRVRIALRELGKIYADITQSATLIIILIIQLYTFS